MEAHHNFIIVAFESHDQEAGRLLGIGKPMAGRLLMFDALGLKFRELKLRRDPACPTCGEGVKPENIQLIDYQELCNVRI